MGKKILGEERREFILNLLKSSGLPITGSELASKANVSRQIIVGDITLLKAKNEPIIATSQGYLYMEQSSMTNKVERTVACIHPPERTEEELMLLVNLGVTVLDVKIEHSVYGDLAASIMVSNPQDVHHFIEKVNSTNASYLSELTDGIHLHTLSATSKEVLDEAEKVLDDHGFLLSK